MTAALLIPLIAIVLTTVAVYRIFAFLRKDGIPQPAPAYRREQAPATSISAETLVPRF